MLLTLLYAHLLYPTRVFLNRGNHEDVSLNINFNFHPNFKTDAEQKFKQYNLAFFNVCIKLFQCLPVATVVENYVGFKCFVCHGGISERLDLKFLSSSKLDRKKFPTVITGNSSDANDTKSAEQLTDLLWSDPLPSSEDGCMHNTQRGIGYFFGKSVSEKFCKTNGFNTIIRSHEMRPLGMTQDHKHCYTVFSCSNYCHGNNKAAVLVLAANDDHLVSEIFETEEHLKDKFEIQKSNVLKTFKKYLDQEANNLLPKLKNADVSNTGNCFQLIKILNLKVLKKICTLTRILF